MTSYKVVFLIPTSAKKKLDDGGWTFNSQDRLDGATLDMLKRIFSLQLKERYLGIEVYVGEGVEVNVIYDEQEEIECVSIKFYEGDVGRFKEVFLEYNLVDVEIFDPTTLN